MAQTCEGDLEEGEMSSFFVRVNDPATPCWTRTRCHPRQATDQWIRWRCCAASRRTGLSTVGVALKEVIFAQQGTSERPVGGGSVR